MAVMFDYILGQMRLKDPSPAFLRALVESKHERATTAGTLSITVAVTATIAWSNTITIIMPSTAAGPATENTIVAGNVVLNADEVAYVTLNRAVNSAVVISTGLYSALDLTENDFIIAFFNGTNVLTCLDYIRLDYLESSYDYYEIFENIVAATGTATIPTGAEIILDRYEGAGDALIVKTDVSGRPIDEPVYDASGNIVTTTFNGTGDWALSAAPTGGYPVSLIYQIRILRKDTKNVSLGQIVNKFELYSADEVEINTIDSIYNNLQTDLNLTRNAGWISGGTITDNLDGTIDVSAGYGYIRTSNSDTADMLSISWPASAGIALTDNSQNYVYVDYNVGVPQIAVTTTGSTVRNNENNLFELSEIYREGTTLYITPHKQRATNVGRLLQRFLYERQRLYRADAEGGLVIGETGTRNISVTAGKLWIKLDEATISAIDTSGADTFTRYYRDGVGGWLTQAARTQWDNLNFDNNAGAPTALNANWYSAQYFWVGADGELISVYGQNQSSTLANIVSEGVPSPIPDRLEDHAIFIGRIVFRQNAAIATQVQSAFEFSFSLSAVTDHGNLAGLTGDDHVNYLFTPGRNTGQIVYGGNQASENLELHSTSNATKGSIILHDNTDVNGELSSEVEFGKGYYVGTLLNRYHAVKSNGWNAVQGLENITEITSYKDNVIGLAILDVVSGNPAEYIKHGTFSTNLNTSTATIGDPVYVDNTGLLTLVATPRQVGTVSDAGVSGRIFVNISGSASSSEIANSYGRQAGLDVDGAINLINADLSLYTVPALTYTRPAIVDICNRNNAVVIVRVAHVDGAIGAVANEDYIYYDIELQPYETKTLIIPGMNPADSILVRSDTTDVNFLLDALEFSSVGLTRLAAITVLADTDTALYNATGNVEDIIIIACNKDSVNSANIHIGFLDGAIGTWSAEDYKYYNELLIQNETRDYGDTDKLSLKNGETIGVRSTDADVNFILYGKVV